MFKKLSDFDADAENHPGRPIHHDHDFDVWHDPETGRFFVIHSDGARMDHSSPAEARKYALDQLNQ